VPTPQQREDLRGRGIDLPRVSAASADPRRRSDYVDQRLTAIGFGIYLGGYLLYLDGLDQPVFVPESHFDFAATRTQPADLAIFDTRDAALAAIPIGPVQAGQPQPCAFYRGAGGAVIAPTLFTPDTTPRVIRTALQAQRDLAAQVQQELAVLALSIVGGMVLRAIISRITRAGGARPSPPTRTPSEIAEELITRHRGSVRTALADLNRMGLSQEDAATTVEAMFRASGRSVANRVRVPNGNLVLTSVRPGVNQPVNIVTPNGQVSFGRATLSLTGDLQAPMRVTNLVSE
jgi:hypothetical protein